MHIKSMDKKKNTRSGQDEHFANLGKKWVKWGSVVGFSNWKFLGAYGY